MNRNKVLHVLIAGALVVVIGLAFFLFRDPGNNVQPASAEISEAAPTQVVLKPLAATAVPAVPVDVAESPVVESATEVLAVSSAPQEVVVVQAVIEQPVEVKAVNVPATNGVVPGAEAINAFLADGAGLPVWADNTWLNDPHKELIRMDSQKSVDRPQVFGPVAEIVLEPNHVAFVAAPSGTIDMNGETVVAYNKLNSEAPEETYVWVFNTTGESQTLNLTGYPTAGFSIRAYDLASFTEDNPFNAEINARWALKAEDGQCGNRVSCERSTLRMVDLSRPDELFEFVFTPETATLFTQPRQPVTLDVKITDLSSAYEAWYAEVMVKGDQWNVGFPSTEENDGVIPTVGIGAGKDRFYRLPGFSYTVSVGTGRLPITFEPSKDPAVLNYVWLVNAGDNGIAMLIDGNGGDAGWEYAYTPGQPTQPEMAFPWIMLSPDGSTNSECPIASCKDISEVVIYRITWTGSELVLETVEVSRPVQ